LGDLTLLSNLTEIKVPSLERDMAALRQFYDATNGENWSSVTWDTSSEDPTEWSDNEQDIVVENNSVVELNLRENNLTGSVPEILNEIRGLTTIDLSNNAIENLADLTGLPNLTSLNVSGNALGYNDLEANILIDGFVFNDQANFGNHADQKISQGSDFMIEFNVEGTSNTYQWFRNGEIINSETSASISIDSLTFDKMGEYRLEVGNELINAVDSAFKIVSNPVQIVATASISGLVSDGNETPTESGQIYLFGYQE
jgi:hypothetical protein